MGARFRQGKAVAGRAVGNPTVNVARGWVLWGLLLAWTARNTVFMRGRAGTEYSTVDVAAGVQIVIVLITAVLLLLYQQAFRTITQGPRSSIYWLTIFYIVCFASAAWSADPFYTAYRAAEFLVLLTATYAAVANMRDFSSAERAFIVVGVLVLVMSMYVNLKLYGVATVMAEGLAVMHTNSYSAAAAVMLVYVIGEWFNADRERRRWLRIGGLFGLAGLLIGTSAASNIAVLAGLGAILALRGHWVMAFFGAMVTCTLWVVTLLLDLHWFDLFGWLFPGKSIDKVETFSGRLGLWMDALDVFLENPVIGQGFAAAAGPGSVMKSLPHSSLVGVMAGTGLLGLSVVFVFLVRLTADGIERIRAQAPAGLGGSAALLTGLVNSLAMPMVLDQWEESTLVFVALLALLVHFSFRDRITSTVAGKITKGRDVRSRSAESGRRAPALPARRWAVRRGDAGGPPK